ncbi:NAT_SF domain containing protein [Candidatus Nanopelagicaceae bacterium]
MDIRQATKADQDRLYEICVFTGDSGKDATGIFQQPQLLGDIWVGPYLHLSPEHCFVVQGDNDEAVGYCIATLDTTSFETVAEATWWPEKQLSYTKPDVAQKENWSRDERLTHLIHNPLQSPSEILDEFPSHAHINLVAEMQGKGWGKKLMATMEDSLRSAGSVGVHLILSSKNLDALAFYKAVGYHVIFEREGQIGVAKKL